MEPEDTPALLKTVSVCARDETELYLSKGIGSNRSKQNTVTTGGKSWKPE